MSLQQAGDGMLPAAGLPQNVCFFKLMKLYEVVSFCSKDLHFLKRKLAWFWSVAAGVDATARRDIWHLLVKYKVGRSLN